MGTALSTNLAGSLIQGSAEPNAARLAASAAASGVRFGGGDESGEGINPSATGLQEGSVNGPAAAARTIERGVESAREVVPNVEDILDIQQQAAAESEAARQAQLDEARAQEDAQAQDAESLVPEAAPGTERFAETNPVSSNVVEFGPGEDNGRPAGPPTPQPFATSGATGELLNVVV